MLDWVDEFAKFEGRHILRARERFATITLLRRLDHAWVEWASVLRQADAYRGAHPMHPQNTDEYLATLLDRTSLQDSEIYPEGESKKERYGLEPGGESSSDLYRCSWCGMPSAVLKRCKACEKARYVSAFFLFTSRDMNFDPDTATRHVNHEIGRDIRRCVARRRTSLSLLQVRHRAKYIM